MVLIPAAEKETAFRNLFNLYVDELCAYNPWLAEQMNAEGLYLAADVDAYFTEENKHPFVVWKDERPLGFVVFSYPDEDDENEDGCDCDIEEFFILKSSRNKGIATEICKKYWEKVQCVCGLSILKENIHAVKFWEKLIT